MTSRSTHATSDRDANARDLRKLALLAVPLGVRVAYEALSWGRSIEQFPDAWDVVQRADMPNLGLGLDSFHLFATKTSLDELEWLDPERIFLVQLADFMWQEIRSVEERIATAATSACSPARARTARRWRSWSPDSTSHAVRLGRVRPRAGWAGAGRHRRHRDRRSGVHGALGTRARGELNILRVRACARLNPWRGIRTTPRAAPSPSPAAARR